MSRYVKEMLALKYLKLLIIVVLPAWLQLGMIILACMFVKDLIVHCFPHKLKVISLVKLGKPFPAIVTYTPPFERPEELVTLVRFKVAEMAVTFGPYERIPKEAKLTTGRWIPAVKIGVLSVFIGNLQLKLVVVPVKFTQFCPSTVTVRYFKAVIVKLGSETFKLTVDPVKLTPVTVGRFSTKV